MSIPVFYDYVEKVYLLHFVNDCLESLGIIHGEVSENLAVDLDSCLVDEAHELGIRKILHTGSGIDTLDPEGTEITLFLLAVAISVGKTLLPGVFGYCPHIATAAVITTGEFEYFLSFGP